MVVAVQSKVNSNSTKLIFLIDFSVLSCLLEIIYVSSVQGITVDLVNE